MNYEKIRQIRNHDNTYARILGIDTKQIEKGFAMGEMPVREEILNINGSVHGGVLFALADTIGGAAAATHGNRVTTASGNMEYLAPAMHTDKLICKAEVVKEGKRLSISEVKVYDEKDKLLAIGLFEYARMKGSYEDYAESISQ